jgi:hypothetical protein
MVIKNTSLFRTLDEYTAKFGKKMQWHQQQKQLQFDLLNCIIDNLCQQLYQEPNSYNSK